jgi:hypothetical protein
VRETVDDTVWLGVEEEDGVDEALGVLEGVTETVNEGVFDPVVV